jgi:hypothetical protein
MIPPRQTTFAHERWLPSETLIGTSRLFDRSANED